MAQFKEDGWMTEDGGPRTDDGGPRTEDRGPKTEDRGRRVERREWCVESRGCDGFQDTGYGRCEISGCEFLIPHPLSLIPVVTLYPSPFFIPEVQQLAYFNGAGASLKWAYFPDSLPINTVIGKMTFLTKEGISGMSYSVAYFVNK